jgi:Flp pilus assembly protein TadD
MGSFSNSPGQPVVAEEKRKNRWLVNTVLVGSVLALIGGTIAPVVIPLMTNVGNNAPQTAPSASPSSAASPNSPSSPAPDAPKQQLEELKKLADGYASVLQRSPDDPTALRGLLETRLALVQLGGANISSTIEPLEKLVKLNPQDTKMAVLLAQARQQSGDLEASAQIYRELLQKQPGELEALGGLSALLISQKKPEAAISLLKDTLKEAPKVNQAAAGSVDTAAVQVLLGKVFASEKRFDDAIISFDIAAKDNPQNFQPVFYKASVLKEQGKIDEARPLFLKAASLAPVEFKDQINREANPEASPSPSASPSASPGGSPTPSNKPSNGAPSPLDTKSPAP